MEVNRAPEVRWATPLYELLRLCNQSGLDRRVLDCGAERDEPPLALFHQYGYTTYGVERGVKPLDQATTYCRQTGKVLKVLRGDMRRIPFASGAFSSVYSCNSIFFMTKQNTPAMAEIERVLAPEGQSHVDLGSVDEPDAGPLALSVPTVIAVVLAALILVLSIPGIVADCGLLEFRNWARILGIILAALDLFFIPVGTAVGIYTLWVLTQRETEQLFAVAASD